MIRAELARLTATTMSRVALVALMLVIVGIPDASAADRKVNGVPAPRQSIITPAIIVLTIFFMLLSLSNAGIGNFGVVALMIAH